MVILVTGGAGTLGRRLALELVRKGYAVRVLCLPDDPVAPSLLEQGLDVFIGDITKKESLPVAVQGVHTIFHLAAVLIAPGREEIFHAVNAVGTQNLVEAAKAEGVHHFIYVSSISVLYKRANAYSLSKLAGEHGVKTAGLKNFTIVRPALVYTDGGAEEFNRFVVYLRKWPIIALPGGGHARKSPVHLEDLVTALLALPNNSKTFGKTYFLVGGDTVTLRQMAHLVLAQMGTPKKMVGIPIWMCRVGVVVIAFYCRVTGAENGFTWQTFTGLVEDAIARDNMAAEDLLYLPRTFRDGLSGGEGAAPLTP